MRPYSPPTDIGRTIAGHEVHHLTADHPRNHARRAAKRLRHAARQYDRQLICQEVANFLDTDRAA
ncbi:hypothetical protein HOU00_gp484 [Caulobacter phage CcrPW]|uniref:Uncharacterized protein n=1 Tax=Caulobacter phage CcrPW TaxID=2283271 RepID=A0A385E9T1_9CAUD|nr:hypothetical protein HOU00_gp484 [Caulobacter phage CcrPW]AXQ68641.1 hypothetical protein CcrPW_gp102 [Caulobacter phage CcrPW]